MAAPYDSSRPPRLGATFHPGAVDDYQMPEVISPAPQRVMPEVPENMQDNLAHFELDASGNNPNLRPHQQQQNFPNRGSSMHNQGASGYSTPGSPSYPPQQPPPQQYGGGYETPNFSPFPPLINPPPNVPPSDEEREANLEHGRVAVLGSNDAEMQLAWAQDALSYVEVAMQNELRNQVAYPPRPQTPQTEHQLKADAINIVTFLAEQRHPRAMFIQGMWLEFGKFGFRVDKKEAFRCYSRAAEGGYARAEYRMGMQFESSNEPLKAIKHYENGVRLGDSASYYRLGMMILLGQHGQRQDYAVGLDHIRYAAQTCDENAPQGAYVYGMLLARELPQVSIPDEYLTHNLGDARINIEKAAYHGFAKAQVKMGSAYELCQLDCDFNPALSIHYNALAARQGEPDAEMAISKWFLCGHEGVFEKNDELAFTYAKRAAQSGLSTAEFALGYFYEIGIYTAVDIKEARSWYAKAAANGNKDASGRIDSISRSKTLSRKDHEKVAIQRIKTQRTQQRFSQQATQFGQGQPVQDTLEMPDPSRMSLHDPTRPMSAAPYPDGPPSGRYGPPRPGPGPNPHSYGPGDHRSSSAFGINPNLRAQSAGPGPQMGPHGYPQGRPPMGPGPGGPGGPGMGPGAPKLDIGFSAPPDLSGADRRRKPNRRPGGPGPGPGPGPAPAPNRMPSSPQAGRGHGGPPGGRPGPGPGPGPGPAAGQPPKPAPSAAASKPSAGQPGKGKGPKTFEEMGVPQGKTENDCVVM
ncbi:hypothetical protein FQN49_006273 [Arthroderma sp. PD_2]|nr:hypothetical protein FQN49_006273 [Arthroderma sp. PD_2]